MREGKITGNKILFPCTGHCSTSGIIRIDQKRGIWAVLNPVLIDRAGTDNYDGMWCRGTVNAGFIQVTGIMGRMGRIFTCSRNRVTDHISTDCIRRQCGYNRNGEEEHYCQSKDWFDDGWLCLHFITPDLPETRPQCGKEPVRFVSNSGPDVQGLTTYLIQGEYEGLKVGEIGRDFF